VSQFFVFKKWDPYLYFSNEQHRPEPTYNIYDILYKTRPALDIINKFKEHYFSSHGLAMDEPCLVSKRGFIYNNTCLENQQNGA
jgi:hypothetical protein